MTGCSCVVVLIGSETSTRPWVDYEIRKAWQDRKGLLGVYINGLKNQQGFTCQKGGNPFANIRMDNGRLMSDYVTTYDPYFTNSKDNYAYIAENLPQWVEQAISKRQVA